MSARDQHPLSVERFGPVRRLQRERWIPVPPHITGLCLQGPTRVLMALDLGDKHRRRMTRGAAA